MLIGYGVTEILTADHTFELYNYFKKHSTATNRTQQRIKI